MSDADLIQASTVLLLRDGPSGGLEVLMVKRNSKIAFGGLWVFPGGRVDDHEMHNATPEEAALAAAVREAEEETALKVSSDDLVGWSHWVPPLAKQMLDGRGPRRRFATWFFAAAAPAGAVIIDGGEIHDHAWLEPALALAKRDAGEIEIVPPTWVTLHQLSQHRNVAEALNWARTTPSEQFTTQAYTGHKPLTVAWHGDAGYDSGDPGLPGGRHRLVMDPDGWRYERTSQSDTIGE